MRSLYTTAAQTKVLPRTELARRNIEMGTAGLRLVLTNGCFDVLHAGHVRYLEAARDLGDALAVGLNDDESVRRLKGEGRPLNSAEDRAVVLAGLASVDFVTIFSEDSAGELVAAIRPAIYVKGGDYAADPADPRFPPEGKVVLDYGGSVKIVPYLAGRSTSSLVQKIATRRG